jgi:heme/copper-type cytochrome/quinol oxidase subunit 3
LSDAAVATLGAVPVADDHHYTSTGQNSRKIVFWTFIGSECMFFGSLIATYLIYKGKSLEGPMPHEILNIPLTSFSAFDLLMSRSRWYSRSPASSAKMGAARLGSRSPRRSGWCSSGWAYEFTHFVHEGLFLQKNLFACSTC